MPKSSISAKKIYFLFKIFLDPAENIYENKHFATLTEIL
jgi:hypothetical protein